jgi:hypothetical protein
MSITTKYEQVGLKVKACIQEVLVSEFCWEAGYPERGFVVFPSPSRQVFV